MVNKKIQTSKIDYIDNDPYKIYRGIIENNISPLKDGRVQVRIYGIHDFNEDKVKSEHLPWAEIEQPLMFGNRLNIPNEVKLRESTDHFKKKDNEKYWDSNFKNQGISMVPNVGTIVFLRLDHGNPNMPIITSAVTAGDNSNREPDFNKLGRVEKLDETIHKSINDTLDEVTKTDPVNSSAFGKTISFETDPKQKEPVSLSDKSIYPDNTVTETKSGHIKEVDDTFENEKVRFYHRTGAYIEFRPDGSTIFKTVNKPNHDVNGTDLNLEKFENDVINNVIHEGNLHTHIMKNVKTYIEKNLDEIISKNVTRTIEENLSEHIKKSVQRQIDEDLTELIKKNVNKEVQQNLNYLIKGNKTQNINGTLTETVSGAVNETYSSGQTTNGGPSVTITAGTINLN